MLFRRIARSSGLIATLVSLLSFNLLPSAYAAPILVNSSIGSGCATSFGLGYIYSNRYVATTNINLSAVSLLIGAQSSANFSTTRVYLFSDNSTTDSPDTIISTFTPDALYGSGDTTTARFVGSQSIAAGSKFWVVPSVRASTFPRCYYTSASIAQLILNGAVPDTSTSGSNTSFARAYTTVASPPNPGTWTAGNSGQIWQISIEALPAPISAQASLQSGSSIATYRVISPITINVNATSKVTFYASKKVIPNCRNVLSVGGIATCNWRPSVIGVNLISAKVVSLDTAYSDTTSNTFQALVVKRSSTR